MKTNRLSQVAKEQIHEAVVEALNSYLSTPPETRHELEKQGNTLGTLVYESILPIIYSTKLGSVLVVMEEGIGNMVMLTPALKVLKSQNPTLKITVWGKEPAVQVIRGWECVDKVITEFDGEYYDLCFFTPWSSNIQAQYGAELATKCKSSFGLSLKGFHEIIQESSLPEFFDGTGELCLPHCQVAEGEERNIVMDKLEELKIGSYVILGDTTLRNFGWERKRWPHYVELATLIRKKFSHLSVILIGDEEDKKRYAEMSWPEGTYLDFCGWMSIPQLAWLIRASNFYVGNDSGPTHIAAAVGAKTYAIFGPTKLAKNKPIGTRVTILTKNLWCSPCQYTERWEQCTDWVCMSGLSAEEVYNRIFYLENNQVKKSVLLVGDFSSGALRNEVYIKNTLEKDFKLKVIPFDYRVAQKKVNNLVDATYELLNTIVQTNPTLVLICGGQGIVPEILAFSEYLSPKTKISVFYVDNRRKAEDWFKQLSLACDNSYWSTGDPMLLSQVFSKLQKPCEFLPIVPDDKSYFPIVSDKDIDVLFVGTPHSQERIQLLEYLVDNGVNLKIYGNGEWTSKLKPFTNPGVFDTEFNKVLNRAKIVVNINIVNDVPLYFSDRVFYPMATKTVGLNKRVPFITDMFIENKHMVLFDSEEDCLDKINMLLEEDSLRNYIAEEGYKLYKEKYTLKTILERVVNEL